MGVQAPMELNEIYPWTPQILHCSAQQTCRQCLIKILQTSSIDSWSVKFIVALKYSIVASGLLRVSYIPFRTLSNIFYMSGASECKAVWYGDVLCVWIIVNAEIWNGWCVHYSGAGLCRVGAVIQLETLQKIVCCLAGCILLLTKIIQLLVCWIALDAGIWCLLWRRRTGDYN